MFCPVLSKSASIREKINNLSHLLIIPQNTTFIFLMAFSPGFLGQKSYDHLQEFSCKFVTFCENGQQY